MNNKIKYQALCEVETSIPVFAKPYWLDAVCGEKNWNVILCFKNGEIVASMPYYIKSNYGISFITQPRYTKTLGPWIKYPENIKYEKKLSFENDVMDEIISQLEKLPIVFFQQCFNYKINNWLPFFWKGYKQTTKYIYRISDISNVNDVLKSFHRYHRKGIEKALQHKLIIDFDLPAREFYSKHCLTLKKRGKTIFYPFELFEKMYNAAYNNNSGKVIYAKDNEGNLHSAIFVIWDSESAYELILITDPDFIESGGSILIVLELIRFLSDKTQSFDFTGSMDEKIGFHLRRFGSVQIPYFHIWKIYSKNPLLQILIYYKLKRLWVY